MKFIDTKFVVFMLLLFGLNVHASKKDEEVNYLDLTALMLKDDNLDRAELALSQVDLKDQELDIQRFYILSGLLSVKKNENQNAIEFIQKAKSLGEVDAVINVHLAQAAFAQGQFNLVNSALDDAGYSIAKIPSIYHMRAQSYWNLNDSLMAIAILDQASKIFPENKSFPKRKIFYFIQLGFNKQAATLGKAYLKKYDGDLNDYIAIGNALSSSGDSTTALQFLETARLKFPADENLSKSLAAVYIKNEKYYSAAKIIHDASYRNPELINQAAELYRRAGSEYMALSLNGLISDQTEKFKQRMGLMLQIGNFEQAAGMENSLKRHHLDDDENIKYALAYSFFKIGNYPKANKYLSQITETGLFKKATELRKIIHDCASESWRCNE
ncbi:MAG: tetratricopeptide repeat protein [Marinicellaceae bacterium]